MTTNYVPQLRTTAKQKFLYQPSPQPQLSYRFYSMNSMPKNHSNKSDLKITKICENQKTVALIPENLNNPDVPSTKLQKRNMFPNYTEQNSFLFGQENNYTQEQFIQRLKQKRLQRLQRLEKKKDGLEEIFSKYKSDI
ncbi:uncharacterized protein ASCRUDRAFT_75602, partial [Ascoidea rubescens DSM 1968]